VNKIRLNERRDGWKWRVREFSVWAVSVWPQCPQTEMAQTEMLRDRKGPDRNGPDRIGQTEKSRTLNHNHSPWVLDLHKGMCCYHSSKWSISWVPNLGYIYP